MSPVKSPAPAVQHCLPLDSPEEAGRQTTFLDPAFMGNRDAPIHRWVPWIAEFSKHFIADALETYTIGRRETVLAQRDLLWGNL